MSQSKSLYLLLLIQMVLMILISGCSNDDTYYKLNGYWEGENINTATGIDWPFNVYIEHRGKDLSGIYTDYRGSITLRNITYTGQDIGFLIDIWPETVTFFGNVDGENSMNGTWSYSGDNNTGDWYLVKDQDPEQTPEEDADSSSNPFAGQ